MKGRRRLRKIDVPCIHNESGMGSFKKKKKKEKKRKKIPTGRK